MKNQKIKEFLRRTGGKVKKAGPVFPAILAAGLAVVVVGSYDSSIPELMLVEAAENEKEEIETPDEKRVVSDLTPLEEMEEEQEETVTIAPAEEAGVYHDGVYYGKGSGFQDGVVTAEVTIAGGAISNIVIVSAQYDGASWLNSCQALISSIIAAQSTNVDTISGATYSSRGIIGAVRDALSQAAAGAPTLDGAPDITVGAESEASEPEVEIGEGVDSEEGYRDGTYTGVGKGFQDGELKVKLTIKKGRMNQLEIVSAQYDGDEFLEMIQPLAKTIIKKQSTNVDAISGATYSSRGLVQAVRDALRKAAINGSKADNEEDDKGKRNKTKNNNEETNGEKAPEEPQETVDTSGGLKDGTYYGSGKGFGDGELKIKVIISNGKITSITIESAQYDGEQWLNSLASMIENMIKTQSANVDSVSGATYSSRGLKQALIDVLKQAAINPSEITVPEIPGEDTDTGNSEAGDDSADVPEGAVVLSGNATCWPDDWNDFTEYGITVDVVLEENKITNITAKITTEENSETASNRMFLNDALKGTGSFSGLEEQIKILSGDLNNGAETYIEVDAVSGATCSSWAIVDAVNDALKDMKVYYFLSE